MKSPSRWWQGKDLHPINKGCSGPDCKHMSASDWWTFALTLSLPPREQGCRFISYSTTLRLHSVHRTFCLLNTNTSLCHVFIITMFVFILYVRPLFTEHQNLSMPSMPLSKSCSSTSSFWTSDFMFTEHQNLSMPRPCQNHVRLHSGRFACQFTNAIIVHNQDTETLVLSTYLCTFQCNGTYISVQHQYTCRLSTDMIDI